MKGHRLLEFVKQFINFVVINLFITSCLKYIFLNLISIADV